MIKNSIIFYYDNDDRLGNYFYSCAMDAKILLDAKKDIQQSDVVNDDCNHSYLRTIEFPKHEKKSLLIIYSHGDKSSFFLRDNELPFIHETIDCDVCLKGGLIYTNACSVGSEFGKNITKKGASFFGYSTDTGVYSDYKDVFIECDNLGLLRLLEGDTLSEAKMKAEEKFNVEIDKIYPDNFMAASFLEEAKKSIIVHGDLTKRFI